MILSITIRPLLAAKARGAMVLAGLAIVATTSACGGKASPGGAPSTRSALVVTTLYPLEYFAQRIGGDTVEVVNLMPPGVEAHDFEPTPADIRRLDRADVIVFSGSGFEPWIGRALQAIGNGRQRAVEASRGLVNTAGDKRPSVDPHVWLDPLKAIEQVKLIRDGLSRADPASAAMYQERGAGLIKELEALHQRFQNGLAKCRVRQFVTSHDAFGHLALRYGLEAVPISGLTPEAEPSAGDMAALSDTIRALGVKHLMVEPVVSLRLTETLAREVGATLLPLHPLESLTLDEVERGETYFSVMDANLTSLRTAMECSP